MAVGLAFMFGFCLPINFYSPYKARNISQFWRTWHISLSALVRDYLFIPLGGSRKSAFRTAVNLILVMFLVGLWHGAGWNYIIWGLYHGLLLLLWRQIVKFQLLQILDNKNISIFSSGIFIIITNFFVVIGWTFFRAENLYVAHFALENMFLFNGVNFTLNDLLAAAYLSSDKNELNVLPAILFGFVFCWFAPNVVQIYRHHNICLDSTDVLKFKFKSLFSWNWVPNYSSAVIYAVLLTVCLLHLLEVSPFLYFDF